MVIEYGELNCSLYLIIKTNIMSVDLRCPCCGDNFGKDKENPTHLRCECGEEIYNEEGYDDDEDED